MPAISDEEQNSEGFIATTENMKEVLDDVSKRLRSGSIPWQSAGRYWGQMNSDTLMPAQLAYDYAQLFNSNNVALEASMATSQMEEDVANDFCKLLGYPNGWGHITHDGSMANLEGIWYMRCVKSIPLAIAEVYPDKVKGMDEWQLLNMSIDEILEILKNSTPEEIDNIKAHSSRSGKFIQKLGKLVVPQTKHYSWTKAVDISGVGLDNMIDIPVMPNYRMNIDILEQTIRKLAAEKTPILGVVCVVGTTEEGAVDEVDKVVALREELKKEGIYFYLHIDAAYGGYGRALILDENMEVIPYDKLADTYKEYGVFNYPVTIEQDVYNGYKAIAQSDSVTIDPHKMGYVPYAAGGIAIARKAMRNIISYFAPYVFEAQTASLPDMLGAYIIGGSIAGATSASVWACHRSLPLNVSGYGKLIGASMEAAARFHNFLSGLTFDVNGKTIEVYPVNKPDFNMVDWVYKEKGNTDLAAQNALNEKMYDYTVYLTGPVYLNRFLSSHTTFSQDEYGDSPLPFVESIGYTKDDWDKTKQLTIMRAAIMTPYVNNDELFNFYANAIKEAMQKKLEEVVK